MGTVEGESVKPSSDRGLYSTRLGNGTRVWYVRCMIHGRRRHFGSFPTAGEARAFYRRMKAEALIGRAGLAQPPFNLTVAQMIDEYLPTVTHLLAYREQVRFGAWWKARFPGRPVLSLTHRDLGDAVRDLLHSGRLEKRHAFTVRHYMKFLQHVMRVKVRPRAWVLDLWADVALPAVTESLPTIATPADERRLYRELGREDADTVRLDLVLGLRRGQLFPMRWEKLRWRPAVYRLPAFKRQKERWLPVPLEAVMILRRKWRRQGRPKTGWLFPDPARKGQHLDANAWYKYTFKPAATRAGLYQRGIKMHSLRHTWATRALEAGVHHRTLQAMGGWSDVKLVERYAHVLDRTMRDGMERAARTPGIGRFKRPARG